MLDIFQTGVISINYVVKVVFGNQSDYHYNQSNTQPSILPLALLPSPSRTHAHTHAHTHTHTCTHTHNLCCFVIVVLRENWSNNVTTSGSASD